MHPAVNGNVSFWYDDIGGPPVPRNPLPGPILADVCIVGAGFTGLWTAYYLKKAEPSLQVVIIEQEFAGFGASGRNGGWLSGTFGWSHARYAADSSHSAVVAMQGAMFDAVDEVVRVARAEGIDADMARADTLTLATNEAQLQRLKLRYDDAIRWGVPAERLAFLSGTEARSRIAADRAQGGILLRDVARVQPAKLVRGLALAVEKLGVAIYEKTTVLSIAPGTAVTDRGTVTAARIIRATEGFTAGLAGSERLLLPLNSAMIATEPLSDAQWRAIGWRNNELLGHAGHNYSYAQRTREGRIAIGGRGVPYRFGSQIDRRGATQNRTVRELRTMLEVLLPQLRGIRIEHAWCGVLGVPRDWCATVGFDQHTGLGWAGGYVGVGMPTTNLAGRTLRDLMLRRDSELTHLPWVQRPMRRWEPEPLRWLGVTATYGLFRYADRREVGHPQRTSRLARMANRVSGRH